MLVDTKHLKMTELFECKAKKRLHETSNIFEFDFVALTTEMVRNAETRLRKQPTSLDVATGFPT